MENYKIDLSQYFNTNYTALVGRANGEELLSKLKKNNIILMDIEKSVDKIVIIIPSYIVTMNKSFFLGFLETRVQELGKEKFLTIYKFQDNDHIAHLVKSQYIDAALGTVSARNIFNA